MDIHHTINYLQTLFPDIRQLPEKKIQAFISQEILKSPYPRVDHQKVHQLMGKNYVPGLFWLRDRKEKPAYLSEESKIPFHLWLYQKFEAEADQLAKNPLLAQAIAQTGKETILTHALHILEFYDSDHIMFLDKIINQEFSDIFRRILMLILTGDSLFIFHNHREFNELGRQTVPLILECTKQYSFRDRLFQSVAGGIIGLNIKEEKISTAPISLKNNFSLNQTTIPELCDKIEVCIHDPRKIAIDCYNEYYNEVINGKNVTVAWMTDDYIQTIFELKFIEEQMTYNLSLTFTLIPRYDSYSNDASYADVMDMLRLPVLERLHQYYRSGRFYVCRNGMDISTFDGYRMSEEVYRLLNHADIVVISGARAYEMSQGMDKIVYYTGIVVCKSYTESITGFSKDSGQLIFLRQGKKEHSFENFAKRAERKMHTDDGLIPVAGKTAREYYEEKYKRQSTL